MIQIHAPELPNRFLTYNQSSRTVSSSLVSMTETNLLLILRDIHTGRINNTLDDAQNTMSARHGRHDCMPISAAGQLDRRGFTAARPTHFCSLNRHTMRLVNSVRQYTPIIEHCPNIICAIIGIQADAFDCSTLYRMPCTSRCSMCNHFGGHLYLIDCCLVCYFCFTQQLEYFPQVMKYLACSP